MNSRSSCLVWFFAALLTASAASAHPLSQGALNVIVHPDRVEIRARVTIEEVVITDMLTTAPTSRPASAHPSITDTYSRHSRYLAEHIKVSADGTPLVGRLVRIDDAETSTTQPIGPDQQHVVYEIDYAPANGPLSAPPANVELQQNVMLGVEVAPGVTWDASYAVRIGVEGAPATEGLLLTTTGPLPYACKWNDSSGGASRTNRGRMIREYVAHGIHHILTGYDHLLFVSALVLAARTFWDLLKVVTAFTVAHTITLALAALRLINLPSGIVEPMIAASIVFVAAQNVLWPRQSKGWARLAAAFGFGLFHGLGFAGGLLDAMQAMSGLTIVLAIASFSLGVEIGHQMVVIPLFFALKLSRRVKPQLEQRDHVFVLTQRYGSAAICAAGMYYLVVAVTSALSVSSHT